VRGFRLAIAACLVLAAVPGTAGAAGVTVVDSLHTVKPKAAPSGSTRARISAARNEFESFQVVMSAGAAPLRDVNVSLASPLQGPGGTIPARNVTIYREAYLDIKHPSDLEGSKGRWPDALIPKVDPFYGEHRDAFPVIAPAGENRVAWVDVLVPAGQAAGNYAGSLRVTARGGFARTIPIDLHVYPFGIPSTSTLQSAFGIEPPVGTGYRDGMVNAMSQLRECFMPIARLGRDIPIHVEENGWPTGPGRPESEQVRALRQMVGAVNDFRGTYNVTDYRWFDLRDHNSSGPNFQQHYGLLRDDYSPKPAFGAYRDLVRGIAR
jgi:hypothetical protein